MIDTFLNNLNIPDACLLNKPVFKKMFQDHLELDQTDKKALSEDVGRIRWQYTLKPETINVAPFLDDEREYLEVAILTVDLNNPSRVKRIASFMHKAIPYPLILIFGHGDKVCVGVAEKRINQADKSKLVVVDHWQTEWIAPDKPTTAQAGFMDAIRLQNLPSTNFYALYEAFQARVVELRTAERTGFFEAAPVWVAKEQGETLKKIEGVEREIAELRTTLKRESQMSRKIALNTKIRTLKDAILKLEATLKNSQE